MGFMEGKIGEERAFGDLIFPKTVLPPNKFKCTASDLEEMVTTEREYLLKLLQQHGAILFRGFHAYSAEDFSRVVKAFEWDEMGYVGATTRLRVADRIYTANEAPIDQLINFHHEMALIKESPSKIFFYCMEPAPEGGETAILPSHIVAQKMEEQLPEVMAKISKLGIIVSIKTAKEDDSDSPAVINKTWKWMLKTDDEVEAEKRAREKIGCNSIKFFGDGSADLIFGPMNPIREFEGKKVWFVPILGYTSNEKEVGISFGDGSFFPPAALHAYQKILDENSVDVKWEKGDVLLLDNLSVQHARRPGKPPRVIYVSLCK